MFLDLKIQAEIKRTSDLRIEYLLVELGYTPKEITKRTYIYIAEDGLLTGMEVPLNSTPCDEVASFGCAYKSLSMPFFRSLLKEIK